MAVPFTSAFCQICVYPTAQCLVFRIHNFSGSKVGGQHQPHPLKSPAEDVLPTATAEAWPTTQTFDQLLHAAAIESILCTSVTVWFGASTIQDKCYYNAQIHCKMDR